MMNETVQFNERTFIQQSRNSFAGSHFALGMLFFNSLGTASAENYFGLFEHFLNFCLSSQVLTPP